MYLVMDEAEELLHPFWLGLLMLFGVIIVMGSICFLRRRCGSNFYHWFNRVRGRDDLNNESIDKVNHRLPLGPFNWTPMYIPPAPSLSPKLYNLVRNMRMAGIDRETIMKPLEEHDEDCEHENTPSAQPSKVSYVEQELNHHRDLEAARRFYASMRQTALAQTDSSIDSSTTEPNFLPATRLMRAAQREKVKHFRTQGFFHSLAWKN